MSDRLKIVYKPIDELQRYSNNPRINEDAVKFVASSIREFNFKVPIVIDRNNIIVCGDTRYLACRELGITEIPCIIADDLTEEQVRAFRLADNKTAEIAEWDFAKLDLELQDILDTCEIDMSDFGFSEWDDGVNLFDDDESETDYEPDEESEPVTKRGDIYRLGRHRLMCGDATSKNDIERLVQDDKVDLVFTDPPYGMNAVSKSGVLSKTYHSDILNDDSNRVAIESFKMARNLFPQSRQVWWGGNYYTDCLPSAECWIVWDKNNGMSDQADCELAWTNFRSVVRKFILASEKTNRVHPTQKPARLITDILERFDSEKKMECVLDLFGGSGSTLIACEQTGRRCDVMELDPKYCDVIIRRWEDMTGMSAELI